MEALLKRNLPARKNYSRNLAGDRSPSSPCSRWINLVNKYVKNYSLPTGIKLLQTRQSGSTIKPNLPARKKIISGIQLVTEIKEVIFQMDRPNKQARKETRIY